MPIILDDTSDELKVVSLDKDSARRTKTSLRHLFHNNALTGTGGKVGLINQHVHPAKIDARYQPMDRVVAPGTVSTTSENSLAETKITTTPTEILLTEAIASGIDYLQAVTSERILAGDTPDKPFYRIAVPEVDEMLHLNPLLDIDVDQQFFAKLTPQTVYTRDVVTPGASGDGNSHDRSIHVYYRVTLFGFAPEDLTLTFDDADDSDSPAIVDIDINVDDVAAITEDQGTNPLIVDGENSFAMVGFSYDCLGELRLAVNRMLRIFHSGTPGHAPHTDIDEELFADWSATEYSLYQEMLTLGETINGQGIVAPIIDYMEQVIGAWAWAADKLAEDHYLRQPKLALVQMAMQLRLLEYHPDVLLSAYGELYDRISDIDDGDTGVRTKMLRQNLNLKLNGNLQALNDMRDDIVMPAPKGTYHLHPRYSTQQRNAITSADPYVMVKAGAGTGKSTVITERIDYLVYADVPPEEILVASFTNAAADNITERSPGVRSVTIAAMIHGVYAHNYPHHELSTIDTIINSLEIFYREAMVGNAFLQTFRNLLNEVLLKTSNATMTRLSTFVENNVDAVLQVLDLLGQTCLELEIIIAYIQIENPDFTEPNTPPKHIIIDEVQDNSTYEFVYMLRYAARHGASLYLVGDASQTLYEFRAANPKALNALEGSGVFTPYRLTTNYRSKQAILDVANIMLAGIEANQFANIQLTANALDEVTLDELDRTVSVVVERASNQREFSENLGVYLKRTEVLDYIRRNLEAGEQTCVMAYTRREVNAAMKSLQESFPHVNVESLVSERAYNSTTFSSFVKNYWDEVTAVDPANALIAITQSLSRHLPSIEPRTAGTSANAVKARNAIMGRIDSWRIDNAQAIQLLVDKLHLKMITEEEFYEGLRDNLLAFEIKHNAIRTSLLKRDNDAAKKRIAETKPPLAVSTIHGVKGLEFDNTIVVRQPDSDETRRGREPEASKRMFYVALTRAKKSEMIIAGANAHYPVIAEMYNMVRTSIEQREERRAERERFDAMLEVELKTATVHTADDDAIWDNHIAEMAAAEIPEGIPSPILFVEPDYDPGVDEQGNPLPGLPADERLPEYPSEIVDNPRFAAWVAGTLDDYDAEHDDGANENDTSSVEELTTEEVMAKLDEQRKAIEAKRRAALGIIDPPTAAQTLQPSSGAMAPMAPPPGMALPTAGSTSPTAGAVQPTAPTTPVQGNQPPSTGGNTAAAGGIDLGAITAALGTAQPQAPANPAAPAQQDNQNSSVAPAAGIDLGSITAALGAINGGDDTDGDGSDNANA